MKTVWVIVVMVLVAAGLTLLLISTAPDDKKGKGSGKDGFKGGGGNVNVDVQGNWTTTDSGLKYEDIKVGAGKVAEPGNTVKVHYTGTLTDGTQFDSSVGKAPFTFSLGRGGVIKGWDEGVAGMKEGGIRKLWVPARLAYGDTPRGNVIPANADLVFEVELLKVQ